MSSCLYLAHILLRAFIGQPMWKVVATSTLLPPWRLLSRQYSDQLLVTVPFLSMHRGHGTAYHLPSELFHPSPLFGNNWRHICLGSVLANFFTTFLTVIMTLWSATVSFAWQRHLNQYEGINNNNKTESPNSIRFMSFIVIVDFMHL